MKVLIVVGMPNSGRTTVIEKARQLGLKTITIDSIIDEEIRRRNTQNNKENRDKIFKWFCQNNNELMRRIIDKIIEGQSQKIIIEGLVNPLQINTLRHRLKNSEISILGIHRPPKLRKGVDVKQSSEIRERDQFFLDNGTPEILSMADYFIVNDVNLTEFRGIVKDKLIDILNIDKER